MAQADAEDRQLAQAGRHLCLHGRQGTGIAGAVAQEQPLEAAVGQLRGGGVPGEDLQVQARSHQLVQDALLDATVQDRHPQGAARVQLVALPTADLGTEGLAHHVRQGSGLGHTRRQVPVPLGPDERGLGPVIPQVLGEGPGVQVGKHGDAVPLQPARQVPGGAVVVGRPGDAAAEEARGPGAGALVQVGVDAVDPLLREGHADHLAGKAGIREDLLVASHGRGEDGLARPSKPQRRPPPEDRSVLEDQVRMHVAPSGALQKPRLDQAIAGR